MDERLRRVLRERIEEYLAGVERLLGAARLPGPWPLVAQRLAPLLTGWRALLETHASGEVGRCRHCDRVRWRRRGPCSVWRVANAHLVTGMVGGAGP